MATLPLLSELAPSYRVIDLTKQIGEPFGPLYWPFNPSIHYSTVDNRWRCAVRLANYSIPDGTVIAPRGATQSHVVMCEIDPASWRVRELAPLVVPAGGVFANLSRAPHCASFGLEDLRLFDVAVDPFDEVPAPLYGIACALELNTKRPGTPEQVLVEIDRASLEITGAVPLRGAWSFRAQKNWAPFDGEVAIRFLYDLERGVVLRARKQSARVDLDNPQIGASSHGIPIGAWWRVHPEDAEADLGARARSLRERAGVGTNTYRQGVEVKTMQRASVAPRAQEVVRVRKPGSESLRGGSQLVPLDVNRWIGVAHEMTLSSSDKVYWHTLYTCNRHGQMLERSEPFKLAEARIEFAAGMQIVPIADEVAISFGVDDHESKLGIVRLAELEKLLRPIEDYRALTEISHRTRGA